ncbi:MAG: helix-turn-helix domain-containing protein [Thermoplasmata archaeon]|nr:helix-turn-helix domain-containing protein [Thermoplasmata archaeon]
MAPEPLADFLFEVASPERLQILSRLSGGARSHTELSRQLARSGSETSRHLQRLTAAGLVEKGPRGKYALTSIARVFYAGLPFLEYLVANRGYLQSHDLGGLEPHFLSRVGELSQGTLTFGAYATVAAQEGALTNVRARVWMVSDEPIDPLLPASRAKLPHGIDVRFLLPARASGPPGSRTIEVPSLISIRTIKPPGLSLVVVDEQAWIRFPTLDGPMDRSTMILLRDPVGLRWAEELFQHLWGQAGDDRPSARTEGVVGARVQSAISEPTNRAGIGDRARSPART